MGLVDFRGYFEGVFAPLVGGGLSVELAVAEVVPEFVVVSLTAVEVVSGVFAGLLAAET